MANDSLTTPSSSTTTTSTSGAANSNGSTGGSGPTSKKRRISPTPEGAALSASVLDSIIQTLLQATPTHPPPPSSTTTTSTSSGNNNSSLSKNNSNAKNSSNPTAATPSAPVIPTNATSSFPSTLALIQSTGVIPTPSAVATACKKLIQEIPPVVHLSKLDSAPQNKIQSHLQLEGGMRGYRMTRATHGVPVSSSTNTSSGGSKSNHAATPATYYYEVWIGDRPTVAQIKAQLPPNVRLAPKLKQALLAQDNSSSSSTTSTRGGKKRSASQQQQQQKEQQQGPMLGGHARIGWSMRTGDLQAPVGYDKWSYAYRDIHGSKVHNSQRIDDWGAQPFGPGDIVGCWIDVATRQIRFSCNGKIQGRFVVSRGKKEGGVAFENVLEGTYYPALSLYLGGTLRVNFGPQFVYPPKGGGGNVRPMSLLAPPPKSVADVPAIVKQAVPKRTDDTIVQALTEALKMEAQLRTESFMEHTQTNANDVKRERQKRNLQVSD